MKLTYLLIIFINCISTDEKQFIPELNGGSQKQFYKYTDPKAKDLVRLVEDLENSSVSFTGEFSMKINSGENLKDSNSLKGKIYFDKSSGKVKIQLMEPFFGLIISQLISDGNSIQIKSSGSSNITTLRMGDILLTDPTTRKNIIIPYPVIHYSIVQNFSKEFKSNPTYLSPDEKKILVKKKSDDEYYYTFYEKGLESLEVYSKEKDLRAIATVPENYRKSDHPPSRIITRVTDRNKKDTSRVDIQYTNIKKSVEISPQIFKLN